MTTSQATSRPADLDDTADRLLLLDIEIQTTTERLQRLLLERAVLAERSSLLRVDPDRETERPESASESEAGPERDPDALLTGAEAAQRIGVAPSTLATWRSRRPEYAPPAVIIGGLVKYRPSELDRWLDERSESKPSPRPVPPSAPAASPSRVEVDASALSVVTSPRGKATTPPFPGRNSKPRRRPAP